MKWNLLPVLNCDGKRMPIETEIALSVPKSERFRLLEPVVLRGEAVNLGGTLEFRAQCSTRLEAVCDRCAETYAMPLDFTIDERIKKEDPYQETEADPDVRIIQKDELDLDEVVYEGLYLALPCKMLCREDCKGLCFVCGRNLNDGSCDCDTSNSDPRFDILDQLL